MLHMSFQHKDTPMTDYIEDHTLMQRLSNVKDILIFAWAVIVYVDRTHLYDTKEKTSVICVMYMYT